MDFLKLQRMADDLEGRTSPFQLAQLKKAAEQGEGELAGLTRFEMAELTRLYERKRQERGV